MHVCLICIIVCVCVCVWVCACVRACVCEREKGSYNYTEGKVVSLF